tara:strand:+ start:1496 stop:2452 length:957 start_codon:yes stop_codon:yes gene_type:complete
MFCYWGGRNYAKTHMQWLFRLNRRNFVLMRFGGFAADKYEYSGNEQKIITYEKFTPNGPIVERTKTNTYNDEELDLSMDDVERNPEKFVSEYNYLDRRLSPTRGFWGRDKPNKRGKLYSIFDQPGKTWEHLLFDKWSDIEMMIPREYILGVKSFDQWKETRTADPYPPFIEYLKAQKHYYPYKEDILDHTITALADFNPPTSGESWGVEIRDLKHAYEINKEIVWSHLDHHIWINRELEELLQYNNIDYEYFNIDDDQWNETFGGQRNISRRRSVAYGIDYYDQENPRFIFMKKISEEYIETRGLTDERLQGRIKDKI